MNVIVTRAKKRLRLFTSMRPSDIKVTPGVARGAKSLRSYLEYAETGIIPDFGGPTGGEPDSDFEIAVASLLNHHGYHTSFQVGVTGFYVDIGVRHPDQEGEFILGIECDGATYHSAKSVRDRDLLRQRILQSKGWKVYRIWSTDWFKNKDRELDNLLEHLEKLVESERAKVRRAEPEEQQIFGTMTLTPTEAACPDEADSLTEGPAIDKSEALRKVLMDYRRKKIEPVSQDLSKSILSDHMLELFVDRKPTTQDEFFLFPHVLRSQVERGQGQFLDEIFEIIEEFTL